jgi:hypothetical protein
MPEPRTDAVRTHRAAPGLWGSASDALRRIPSSQGPLTATLKPGGQPKGWRLTRVRGGGGPARRAKRRHRLEGGREPGRSPLRLEPDRETGRNTRSRKERAAPTAGRTIELPKGPRPPNLPHGRCSVKRPQAPPRSHLGREIFKAPISRRNEAASTGRVFVRVLAVNPRPRTSIGENGGARSQDGGKHGGERPEALSAHLGPTTWVDVGWRGRRDSNPRPPPSR